MLTIPKISFNMKPLQICIVMKGETKIMTENEKELIQLIRENDNPGQALMTATVVILGFLKQLESSESQAAADLQVRA